jgi:hypothetical protein
VTIRITTQGLEKTFTQTVNAASVEKAVERAVMLAFLAVRVDDDEPPEEGPNLVARSVVFGPMDEDPTQKNPARAPGQAR